MKKTPNLPTREARPPDGSYQRATALVPQTVDPDERKVQAVVATETPVMMFDWDRWEFVDEILLADGARIPDKVPLTDTHQVASVRNVLGGTRDFEIRGSEILAWNYFADTEPAREAWTLVENGFVTDNSIRYRVDESKSIFIDPGKTKKHRGKTYTAGADRALKLSTNWELVHNCVCAHGADSNAKMRSEQKEARPMKFTNLQEDYIRARGFEPGDLSDQQGAALVADMERAAPPTPDPVPDPLDSAAIERARQSGAADERKRREDIRALNAQKIVDDSVVDRAIDEGMTLDQTRDLFLKTVQANQVHPGAPNIITGNVQLTNRHLEIALCRRARIPEAALIKKHSDRDVNMAMDEFEDLTLLDVCRASLQLSGKPVPRKKRDLIRAAFSTYALTQTLANTANITALNAYQMAPASWREWCSIGSVADFKQHTRVRVTDMGDLETIENQGVFTHGSAAEEYETITAKTRGKLFAVSRNDIVNDNIDALVRTPAAFGRKAATKISDLVYTSLLANGNMSDGTALFHADHNNLNTSAALNATNLPTAIQGFRNQTDQDGDPIDVAPFVLLVPPNLENIARSLLESDLLLITGSTDSTIPASNVLRGSMRPVVEPRLENSNFTGYSTTTWYVTADPSVHDTLEVAFLNGNQNPVVEQFDMNPDTLGVTYRVYIDVGVAPMDYRTLQQNTA